MNFLQTKIFRKIFITDSLIIIVSIFILAAFITDIVIMNMKNNQMYLNKKSIEEVNNTFTKDYGTSKYIVNSLYGQASTLTDVINFLQNDYNEYLKMRLDLYYDNNNTSYSVNSIVKNYFSEYSDIKSITFYSYSRDTFYTFYSSGNSKIIYNVSKKINFTNENRNIGSYLIDTLKKITQKTDNYSYYTINDIKDSYTLNTVGSIIIKYDLHSLDKIVSNYEKIKNNILVINKEGTVLYDFAKKYSNKKYPYLDKLAAINKIVHIDGYCYEDMITTISGIRIVGVLPISSILYSSKIAILTIIILIFLVITVGEVLVYYKTKSLSNRMYNISSAMSKVQKGDFETRIPRDNEDDEFSMISQNFNDMCEKLNQYIHKVYLMEISQKNAEMTALQSQINPHFLYNTLESIRMKAVSSGDTDVGQMLYNLAYLFRNMIKGSTLITIEKELYHCKMYLDLFKFRYEDKFDYCIDASEELLNKEIVKFTIQPIIENFIVHGIRLDSYDNYLLISVEKEKEDISIIVEDNGKGIDKQKLSMLKDRLLDNDKVGNSIGMINVHERIQLQYGKSYGLSIEDKETCGAKIIIKIPNKEVNGYV